jgi:hypothetical protein
MDRELAALKVEMQTLRAQLKAHDFVLAALAAHIQVVTVPGFLAWAFDSAANTAAQIGRDRDDNDVLPLVPNHIKRMRAAFDGSFIRPGHGH